jgi:hypothetical protein
LHHETLMRQMHVAKSIKRSVFKGRNARMGSGDYDKLVARLGPRDELRCKPYDHSHQVWKVVFICCC